MIHATDADSLRALLKDEYSDYADTSAEWKQQAITYLTLRGAEATLQELCGQQVTLARLLTMVSRIGLGSVVGRDNEIKLWDPRTGEHLGTFGDGAINCEDVVRAGWFGHAPDTPAVRRMDVDVPPADNGTKTTSPIITLVLPA